MWHSLSFRRLALKLAANVAVVWSVMLIVPAIRAADETPAPRPTHYHADPEQLWNRLHEALFVRDGWGQDRLEPLLWSYSKHLLEAQSNERASALLAEFLKNNGEKLIDDPLKRAVLQRDLWMVFNWLDRRRHPSDFVAPKLTEEEISAAEKRLRGPLAAVIRRLELSPQEIRDLPDNYAAAVASEQFAKSLELATHDKKYLPAELFAADGPWVCVGRIDGRTAPLHLDGTNPFTNSVFFLFLRLPDGNAGLGESGLQGRAGVAEFLKQRPAIPKGTELALVRRAMLIDTSHHAVLSNLTESIQLRTIRDNDVPNEFRLSRAQLFAGRGGGLHATGNDEEDFKTGFSSRMWDALESNAARGNLPSADMQPIKRGCIACHDKSRSPELFQSGGTKDRPHPLAVMPATDVAAITLRWRESHPNWGALRTHLVKSGSAHQ